MSSQFEMLAFELKINLLCQVDSYADLCAMLTAYPSAFQPVFAQYPKTIFSSLVKQETLRAQARSKPAKGGSSVAIHALQLLCMPQRREVSFKVFPSQLNSHSWPNKPYLGDLVLCFLVSSEC